MCEPLGFMYQALGFMCEMILSNLRRGWETVLVLFQ